MYGALFAVPIAPATLDTAALDATDLLCTEMFALPRAGLVHWQCMAVVGVVKATFGVIAALGKWVRKDAARIYSSWRSLADLH